MLNTIVADILAHYDKACEKHPYFADNFSMFPVEYWVNEARHLKELVRLHALRGDVEARLVLQAEVSEVFEAIALGNFKQAREECFDTIAVLIRILDVIDGVESFGKKGGDK